MCCIYIYKSILVKQPQTRKQVTLVSDVYFENFKKSSALAVFITAGLGDAGDQKLGDQESGRGFFFCRCRISGRSNFVAEICLNT